MILQEKFRMWLLRWAHVEPCMSFFSVEIKREVSVCKWEGLRCIRCYTLSGSFKQSNHNLLNSTWNSAQCYVPAWMREGLGGKWIYTCVAEFLETTTLLTSSALCCALSRSRVQLWDPMDCSPPGSSVYGDSPGKNTGVGCHTLLQGIFPTQGSTPGLPHCRWILYHLSHLGSPRILEWVTYSFSLTQESNWGFLHCRQIL